MIVCWLNESGQANSLKYIYIYFIGKKKAEKKNGWLINLVFLIDVGGEEGDKGKIIIIFIWNGKHFISWCIIICMLIEQGFGNL